MHLNKNFSSTINYLFDNEFINYQDIFSYPSSILSYNIIFITSLFISDERQHSCMSNKIKIII